MDSIQNPPTCESISEPMTPERIAELRALAGPPSTAEYLPIAGYALAVLECLDEVDRLREAARGSLIILESARNELAKQRAIIAEREAAS